MIFSLVWNTTEDTLKRKVQKGKMCFAAMSWKNYFWVSLKPSSLHFFFQFHFFLSVKNYFSNLKENVFHYKECFVHRKVPWMLKVHHGPTDANKEALFLRVCIKSQWGLMLFWTPLAFIIWTKQLKHYSEYNFPPPQKKGNHTGLEQHKSKWIWTFRWTILSLFCLMLLRT